MTTDTGSRTASSFTGRGFCPLGPRPCLTDDCGGVVGHAGKLVGNTERAEQQSSRVVRDSAHPQDATAEKTAGRNESARQTLSRERLSPSRVVPVVIEVAGSPALQSCPGVAQLAEQPSFKRQVAGSTPAAGTTPPLCQFCQHPLDLPVGMLWPTYLGPKRAGLPACEFCALRWDADMDRAEQRMARQKAGVA